MNERPVSWRYFLVAGLVLSTIAPCVGAAETAEDLAQKAAESWLKLVDTGKFDESWTQAASLFKRAVTKAQWAQAADEAVKPLGKLVSRQLKLRQFAEKLPRVPDGKYVVIQYDSVFENKSAAVETVTPMLDADGVWRVSGYFVK